jgi:hypothetical protein
MAYMKTEVLPKMRDDKGRPKVDKKGEAEFKYPVFTAIYHAATKTPPEVPSEVKYDRVPACELPGGIGRIADGWVKEELKGDDKGKRFIVRRKPGAKALGEFVPCKKGREVVRGYWELKVFEYYKDGKDAGKLKKVTVYAMIGQNIHDSKPLLEADGKTPVILQITDFIYKPDGGWWEHVGESKDKPQWWETRRPGARPAPTAPAVPTPVPVPTPAPAPARPAPTTPAPRSDIKPLLNGIGELRNMFTATIVLGRPMSEWLKIYPDGQYALDTGAVTSDALPARPKGIPIGKFLDSIEDSIRQNDLPVAGQRLQVLLNDSNIRRQGPIRIKTEGLLLLAQAAPAVPTTVSPAPPTPPAVVPAALSVDDVNNVVKKGEVW